MKKNLLFIAIFTSAFFLSLTIYSSSLNMSGVRAYPVPFSPQSEVLTIDDRNNLLACTPPCEVTLDVYDINGEDVATRRYISTLISGQTVVWNGRNSRGNIVKPGFYMIKLTVQGSDGGHGEKILKIVVK